MLTLSFFIFLAYLAGSVSFAVIVCRLAGLPDPRTRGSGNPGTKNVWRIGNSPWLTILVLLGDTLKGALPVYLAAIFDHFSAACMAWIMLAAAIGHIWPIFFNFRGGVGLATAIGAILVIHPSLGLLLIIIAAISSGILRDTSRGAMVATFTAPFLSWFILGGAATIPVILASIAIEIMAYIR